MSNTIQDLVTLLEIAVKVRTSFVNKHEGGDPLAGLAGYCGAAAQAIKRQARRRGIKVRVVANDCHHFVRYKEWLIDVTATQFSDKHKPVEFFRLTKGRKLPEHWKEE